MQSKSFRVYRIAVAGIFLSAIIVLLGIRIQKMASESKAALEENLPITYSLSSEDSNLISNEHLSRLKVIEVRNTKVRPPVSVWLVDDKYYLIKYKIIIAKKKPIDSLLHIQLENADQTNMIPYNIIGSAQRYKFKFKAAKVAPVSKIYLTFAVDSLHTIKKTDSLICYHSKLVNMSIKYDQDAPVDIFVVGEDGILGSTRIVPMNILFLERGSAIYLMLMTAADGNGQPPPNLLHDLTKH